MILEIEQKYLIKSLPHNIDDYEHRDIVQGYLSFEPVLRIRKVYENFIFTFKARYDNVKGSRECVRVCDEFERNITREAFEHLLKKCDGSIIEKRRYVIPLDKDIVGVDGLKAEVDVFGGLFEGLSFVEVEFNNISECEAFIKPDWFGENVSDDEKYNNNFIATITSRNEFLSLFNLNGGKSV